MLGKTIKWKKVEDNRQNWANVAAFNRRKYVGVNQEYVKPQQVNESTVVTFTHKEVREEMQRWEPDVVVYILGTVLTFYVIKQYCQGNGVVMGL